MFPPRPHHPILHSHASSPASSPFLISLRYANKPTFLASFSKSRRCQMWLLSMRWVILILLQIDLLLLTVKVKNTHFVSYLSLRCSCFRAVDPWRPDTPHSDDARPRLDTILRPFKLIPGTSPFFPSVYFLRDWFLAFQVLSTTGMNTAWLTIRKNHLRFSRYMQKKLRLSRLG